jgi:hypothetical protein
LVPGEFFWSIKFVIVTAVKTSYMTASFDTPHRIVIFFVFVAVTVKNAVFWDVTKQRNIPEDGILQNTSRFSADTYENTSDTVQ